MHSRSNRYKAVSTRFRSLPLDGFYQAASSPQITQSLVCRQSTSDSYLFSRKLLTGKWNSSIQPYGNGFIFLLSLILMELSQSPSPSMTGILLKLKSLINSYPLEKTLILKLNWNPISLHGLDTQQVGLLTLWTFCLVFVLSMSFDCLVSLNDRMIFHMTF